MYEVASLLPTLPVLGQKCCHLFDEYVFQVSSKHPAALVLDTYLFYLLVIGLEEHVEPLERNINIRISALFSMFFFCRLSTGEGVPIHLVPNGLLVIAEVDCRLGF